MVATTADAPHLFRGGEGMTLGKHWDIVTRKKRDIFRYGKRGKSLAGVGRWGLLILFRCAFCAPRGPKSP